MSISIQEAFLAVLRNGTAGDNPFTQTPEVQDPWFSAVSDVYVPRKHPTPSFLQRHGWNPQATLSEMFGSSTPPAPVGPSRYDEAMGGLPEGDRYRLYIDRNRQAQGPDCFDRREPGYAKGMQEAFEVVRNLVGKPLTVETYQMIHDTAVNGVFNHFTSSFMEKGFGVGHHAYGLDLEIKPVTPEARREWETEKLIAVNPKWWRSSHEYLDIKRHKGT